MKWFNVVFTGLLLVITVLDTQGVLAAPFPDGSIKFAAASDGGGKTCELAFVTSRKDFGGDSGCANDEMSYFRLENVPSATTFKLESERCDGTKAEWYFTMKTIKQPVTTGWIAIATLKAETIGAIVTPGLRLMGRKTDTSVPLEGKLTCVDIERSPLP